MIDIYPAIDIYNGKAVSLTNGDINNKNVYGDPVEYAMKFTEKIKRLHIIDLNGALTGNKKNIGIIQEIISNVNAFVQVGGGFRTLNDINYGYKIGADSIILGTSALNDEIIEKSSIYSNITVSIDVFNNSIRTNGWKTNAYVNYGDFYNSLNKKINRFIYTSIKNDGTKKIEDIQKFWNSEYFMYAGGVNTVNDIINIENSGFSGVIIGKALYENGIKMEELKCLQKE